jgi:antitoxin CptB
MSGSDDSLQAQRRRAIFRASRRGTRELDWVLGRFAQDAVAAMAEDELAAFEEFLALPDPDIERWVVHGATPRPNGTAGDFVARVRRFHGIGG